MASSGNDLTLHLALDEIQDGLALDETANDNDGTVRGDPQLLPDELFGSCFTFDGADDYVEIKDPFQGSKDFTVAVWLKPAALDDGQTHGALGFTSKPSLWLAPSAGALQYDSYDAAQKQYAGVLDNFFTTAGEWVHAAWVREGTEYRFYRGGQLFATHEAPAEFAAGKEGYYVGRVDSFWQGALAHARVYARALTADEIREMMLDDQTAAAAFRKSHPIEFSVYDADQQPVIVIDDGGAGHPLYIEIANSSQRSIELAPPKSPTPSPDNYHFALRFRPGALSATALARVGPAAEKLGWAAYQEQRADGLVSLYFLQPTPPKDRAASPGQSIVLMLPNVSASAAGGSRGTRVELGYSQLRYVGETTQLSGSRVQHLEIISERGKRNVPLHVGFLGSNRVLNDGQTPNELRLRITNTLAEHPIPLSPKTSDSPTTFILSFDVQGDDAQREWALGTSDDVQNMHVSVVRQPQGNLGGSLVLHLPLSQVEDGSTPDESGSAQKAGSVKGNPTPLPEDLLGGSLRFDGGRDYVEVVDPFVNRDTFTISIWACPDVIDDGQYHGLVGYQDGADATTRKPGLWQAPTGGGLHFDSYEASTKQRYSAIMLNFFTKASEWVHIAWVNDGTRHNFYRNGEFMGWSDAPRQFAADENAKYWVGRVDNFWKGRLAHARVYSRALSVEEIQKVMLDDRQFGGVDTDWEARVVGLGGETPQWELTTTKTELAPGEIIQVRLRDFVSSLPSGQTNLYLRYQNLPGYWDGQLAVTAEKLPLVTRGQRVGLGVNQPRSALDTGLGVLTGAAADYQRAQATLSGGGKVTWTQEGAGGRLKWSQRFVAVSMGGLKQSFKDGYVNIKQPTSNIPAANVWDGRDRLVNSSGLLLSDWEALYAVHRVGGGQDEVEFRIVIYGEPFTAQSNWLLVAVRNDDDKTVRLGTGVTLSLGSSSTNGSPVMSGTIIMWSGDEKTIPDGWVLCNGRKEIKDVVVPDLTSRFVLGAGPSATDRPDKPKTYKPGTTGGQERVTLKANEVPSHAHGGSTGTAGDHAHGVRFDSGGGGDLGGGTWPKSDPQNAYANWRATTDNAGNHTHVFTTNNSGGDAAHDNMPPYWALCFIMKL